MAQVAGSDPSRLHRSLVEGLASRGLLSDPRIEAAFAAVPRHLFLPHVSLETVYTDEAVLTKLQDGAAISSSSQPAVMAVMLDQLGLEPGHRVLEIGAGTGYNAALMAHLVGPTGQVVTVDIDEDIVEGARAHLAAAGFSGVCVVQADGALGYPEAAPYDRIILSVCAWEVAPAWVEQLKPRGRLLLPLALNGIIQKLVAFERNEDHLESVSVREVSFMPLRGISGFPHPFIPLGPGHNLLLALVQPRSVDPERVSSLLTGPHGDQSTSVEVTRGELSGVAFWLTLHDSSACGVIARGEAAVSPGAIPAFIAFSGFQATVGLLDAAGLCLLGASADAPPSSDKAPFSLAIRSFGADQRLGQRLLALLHGWEEAGRPFTSGLQVSVYPKGAAPAVAEGEALIVKPQTELVLRQP